MSRELDKTNKTYFNYFLMTMVADSTRITKATALYSLVAQISKEFTNTVFRKQKNLF